MKALFGGKAGDELDKLISPKKQNKILFFIMVFLIVFGLLYIVSFYI